MHTAGRVNVKWAGRARGLYLSVPAPDKNGLHRTRATSSPLEIIGERGEGGREGGGACFRKGTERVPKHSIFFYVHDRVAAECLYQFVLKKRFILDPMIYH